MIITLKGADFSSNNIGTLTSWLVTYNLKGVTGSSTNMNTVERGSAFQASFNLEESVIGEYNENNEITITMGGVTLNVEDIVTYYPSVGTYEAITVNIPEVTGNIVITVKFYASDEPVTPDEPDIPSATTWYIDDCDKYADTMDKSANIIYYGFAYQSDKMASVYNKPVNAIKVNSSSTSGKLPVYRISTSGDSSLIKEFTISNSGIQELKFDSTIVLTDGENIAVGDIEMTSGQVLIKFGSTTIAPNEKFYVKVPSANQSYSGSAGFNIGYVV